jgi:hypothetical protein
MCLDDKKNVESGDDFESYTEKLTGKKITKNAPDTAIEDALKVNQLLK